MRNYGPRATDPFYRCAVAARDEDLGDLRTREFLVLTKREAVKQTPNLVEAHDELMCELLTFGAQLIEVGEHERFFELSSELQQHATRIEYLENPNLRPPFVFSRGMILRAAVVHNQSIFFADQDMMSEARMAAKSAKISIDKVPERLHETELYRSVNEAMADHRELLGL